MEICPIFFFPVLYIGILCLLHLNKFLAFRVSIVLTFYLCDFNLKVRNNRYIGHFF